MSYWRLLTLLLLPLLCNGCVKSDEDYELKSPCVSYSESGTAPCERRPVNHDLT